MNDKIISKLTSGRFIMTVAFTVTYCLVIIASIVLAIMKLLMIETFLALIAGFLGLTTLIVESYFKRDRKNGGDNVSSN